MELLIGITKPQLYIYKRMIISVSLKNNVISKEILEIVDALNGKIDNALNDLENFEFFNENRAKNLDEYDIFASSLSKKFKELVI